MSVLSARQILVLMHTIDFVNAMVDRFAVATTMFGAGPAYMEVMVKASGAGANELRALRRESFSGLWVDVCSALALAASERSGTPTSYGMAENAMLEALSPIVKDKLNKSSKRVTAASLRDNLSAEGLEIAMCASRQQLLLAWRCAHSIYTAANVFEAREALTKGDSYTIGMGHLIGRWVIPLFESLFEHPGHAVRNPRSKTKTGVSIDSHLIGSHNGYVSSSGLATITCLEHDVNACMQDILIDGKGHRFDHLRHFLREAAHARSGYSKAAIQSHIDNHIVRLAGGAAGTPTAISTTTTTTTGATTMSEATAAVADTEVTPDVAAEDTSPAPSVPETIKPLESAHASMINIVLSQAGYPDINSMIQKFNEASTSIAAAVSSAEASKAALEVERRKAMEVAEPSVSTGHVSIPSGKVVVKKAADVFGITKGKETFGFDIPVWEWDAPHPHVPAIDPNYVFRPFELLRCLYAVITNQRCYLHGHTGSGKTTLVEQIAARLNWPFQRVNFDSEITRMDLIGREVLVNDGGTTTSKFIDGILPQAIAGPYILCCDEIDFVRPDVAYVMQRVLEGNGLMMTEDGGRVIKPHRMSRLFATGNTVGQGDEFGLYQGARPQSMAFLDRFTVWVSVDYLDANQRKSLLKSSVTGINEETLETINKYVDEHLVAFVESNVLQPLSPRGYIALGNACVSFLDLFPDSKAGQRMAYKQAFETTILDRATAQDRAVLSGIVNRILKA